MSTSTLLDPGTRAGRYSRQVAARVLLRFAAAFGLAFAATGAAWAASPPPYVIDGGLISRDAFAGSESRNYIGQKLVSLDDGSVVVAGIVPAAGGGGGNIGLVHYNATTGARVPWANPGQYAPYDNEHIRFPNTADAAWSEVRSIVHHNGYFYVLAKGVSYVHGILIFKDSGEYVGVTGVGAGGDVAGGDIAVYRIGSVLTGYSHWLVYGGTVIQNGHARPVFRRYQISSSTGKLTSEVDATFPNPGNYCPTNRSCYINAIATGKPDSFRPDVFPSHPRVYLAGSRWSDAHNYDFMVMAVNRNGSPELGFHTNGVMVHAFDDGGSKNDSVNAVAVVYEQQTPDPDSKDDTIYLVGNAAQCRDGIGVVAFDGAGNYAFDFHPFILGGVHTSNGGPCLANAAAHYAGGAIVDGPNLVISGMQVAPCFFNCPREDAVDGLLAVVDRTSTVPGSYGPVIPPIDIIPYTDTIGGPRTRHGAFTDVVASGNGKYTVAGSVRTFESSPNANNGVNQYAKARLMRDSIFANGFEHR